MSPFICENNVHQRPINDRLPAAATAARQAEPLERGSNLATTLHLASAISSVITNPVLCIYIYISHVQGSSAGSSVLTLFCV